MAKTLYDLALEYLNQGMPDITQAPGTTTPTPTPTPTPVTPQNPNAPTLPSGGGGGGGGGGNNVYNSNSNSNYLTRPYQNAINDSLLGTPDYQGVEQTSGLESLMGKIPGIKMLADRLPVNQTAILNNELIGAGMQLNDIGQFVSDGGDINKADGSNIMAGYNASKVTKKTFDKRRDVIEKNMKDPKQKAAKLAALDAAEASFFGAKAKADMVFDNKSLAKNPDYISQKIINQKMKEALEGEDDSDEDIDSFDPLNQIDSMPSFSGMNAPSAFTLTAPQYGASFGQGYGSGYGNDPIITGGTNLNDFDGLGPITGGTNQNDFVGLGPITGGTNQNDFVGLGPITGGTNQNDYSGGGYDPGNGYNSTGQGGPAGQGSITNPSNYGTGSGNLGDYQMQPSTPTYQTGTTTRPGSGGGGGGNDSGGGGKIVCTMMNESYGFGSFRNKIWLKHSKDMAPEYQIGYHKIFLPLIKISKTNKVVKKILEHIAVHRTIDIRQEARGKVHLLGRLYRKILEPLCYLVGKNG